jgi:hypothetical protein
MVDEIYRFKHIGSGKYLALSDDKQDVILRGTANSPLTLFVLRSDMQTKKSKPDDEAKNDQLDRQKCIRSGQRILIQALTNYNYL